MSVPNPAAVVEMTEHMKKIAEAAKDAGKAMRRVKDRSRTGRKHEERFERMTHRPFADSKALRQLQMDIDPVPEGTERFE